MSVFKKILGASVLLASTGAWAGGAAYLLMVPMKSPEARIAGISLSLNQVELEANTGSASTRQVVVHNSGSATVQIASIEATGDGFSVSNDCGNELSPGASCTLTVNYSAAMAAVTGNLTLITSAGTKHLALSGSPLYDTLVTGNQVDFGDVMLGASLSRQLVIQNTGTAGTALRFEVPSMVTIAGCATVAAASTCTADITWEPTRGEFNGQVHIQGGHSAAQVALKGKGLAPASIQANTSISFPSTMAGSPVQASWVLKNVGDVPSAINLGVLPAGVSASSTCASQLSANASCTITFTWSPSAVGVLNGTVSAGGATAAITGTASEAITFSQAIKSFGQRGVSPLFGSCTYITVGVPAGVSLTGVSGNENGLTASTSTLCGSNANTAYLMPSSGGVNNAAMTVTFTFSNGLVISKRFEGITSMVYASQAWQ